MLATYWTNRHKGKALKNPFDSAFDLLCTSYSRFQRVVEVHSIHERKEMSSQNHTKVGGRTGHEQFNVLVPPFLSFGAIPNYHYDTRDSLFPLSWLPRVHRLLFIESVADEE